MSSGRVTRNVFHSLKMALGKKGKENELKTEGSRSTAPRHLWKMAASGTGFSGLYSLRLDCVFQIHLVLFYPQQWIPVRSRNIKNNLQTPPKPNPSSQCPSLMGTCSDFYWILKYSSWLLNLCLIVAVLNRWLL